MFRSFPQRQFSYPPCEDPQHNSQQLNFVCLERKCPTRGLICSLCREAHNKHNVVPLRRLLEQLAPNVRERGDQSQSEMGHLKDLQLTYFGMMESLKVAVQRLSNSFRSFQQDLIRNYSMAKERIIDQSLVTRNLAKILEMLVDSDDCLEVLRIEMKKIADLIVLDKSTGKLTAKLDKYIVEYFPQAISTEFKRQEQLIGGTLKSLCSVFDENLSALKYTLTKPQTDFVASYKFSNTLKSKSIAVFKKSLGARQNETNNGDLRFALIQPSLPMNRSSRISFTIQKCVNWIGVGICLKDTVVEKGYKFTYNSIGHGSYLVSSNGYIWSNTIAQDNMKSKGFNFTTGDIVSVQFDPLGKKIVYETGKNRYEQVIAFDITKDIIHFCANLCSQNDEVRIRSEQEISQ